MNKKTIFVAGLMTGLTKDDALAWRYVAKKSLEDSFNVYVPNFYGPEENITGSRIWRQGYFQLDHSDIILVNMDYPDNTPFLGTSMEISRAFYQNKPIVMYSSYDWVHENKTLQYHCIVILHSLNEAIDYIRSKFY